MTANQPHAQIASFAGKYMAASTILRLDYEERRTEHKRGLILMGQAALDHWSAPELAAYYKVSISTMKRRLSALEYSGAIRRLEGRELIDANRHRLQFGGRPSSRLPTLYGRGKNYLEYAGEIEQVRRGRLPARAGVRVGRRLKLHNVALVCTIEKPPSIWLDSWNSTSFGKNGQVHHKRIIEVDDLEWRAVLWESKKNGFSTATITLSSNSNPRIDAGQTESAAVQLWDAAVRAKNAIERTHNMRLNPMHPDQFFERVHAALGVATDVEAWLSSLPLESRRWRTLDGELVWADASDGPMDLESNLPDSHVLPQMEQALAWALKDPDSLIRMVNTCEAMMERLDNIETSLASILNGSKG